MKYSNKMILTIVGLIVLLIVGSATVASHEGHGPGPPSTPLEPSDEPKWIALVIGAIGGGGVVILGMGYKTGIVSTQITGIGVVGGMLLLGIPALLALGVM